MTHDVMIQYKLYKKILFLSGPWIVSGLYTIIRLRLARYAKQFESNMVSIVKKEWEVVQSKSFFQTLKKQLDNSIV